MPLKILCLLLLTATLTVTANPDTACTPQNTPVTTSVMANDISSGAPLDPASVKIAKPSANGTATVNPDGTITFTPAAGFAGTTTYSYQMCDISIPKPVCETLACEEAESTVAANPDAACTPRNTPVTTSVLANDTSSGAPLDPASVKITKPSANGTAKVNPDGTITFTPTASFAGTTTYSYRVCDISTPKPVCATAVVTISVTRAGVVTINVTTASSCGAAAAPAPAPTPGGMRISIKNEYDAKLNFGFLGKGTRNGTDTAKGVLRRQGNEYVGIVDADVDSTQAVSGLGQACGPASYQDSQKLKVVGHPVNGFNPLVQSVDPATMRGQASNEYLSLEFTPETMTSQQTSLRLPEDMLPDMVVSCHTLIDTLSGIAYLPLNDTRWTMDGGGYVIRLPSSGVLEYTDTTVPAGAGASLGPFEAKKSVWTIRVERSP